MGSISRHGPLPATTHEGTTQTVKDANQQDISDCYNRRYKVIFGPRSDGSRDQGFQQESWQRIDQAQQSTQSISSSPRRDVARTREQFLMSRRVKFMSQGIIFGLGLGTVTWMMGKKSGEFIGWQMAKRASLSGHRMSARYGIRMGPRLGGIVGALIAVVQLNHVLKVAWEIASIA